MKKLQRFLLLVLLCSSTQVSWAQSFMKNANPAELKKAIDYGQWLRSIKMVDENKPFILDPVAYQQNFLNQSNNTHSANKSAALGVVKVGSAHNAYTIINDGCNQVFVDNSAKMLGWIHRQNRNLYGGNPDVVANGVHRFDYSLDGGLSFGPNGEEQLDQGPLNPMPFGPPRFPTTIVARPRYPQALVYSPTGSSGVNSLRMAWFSPTTDGNGWGNYNFGFAKNLANIGIGGTTAPVNPDVNHNFASTQHDQGGLIPSGISMARNGEIFVVDNTYKPSGAEAGLTLERYQIWKGKANGDHSNITWERHAYLNPGNLRSNAQGSYYAGNVNIAFSPDGKWGWIASTPNVNLPERDEVCESVLMFYRSSDYGDTWEGPMYFIARDYKAVVDSIKSAALSGTDTVYSSGIPSASSFDLAVDANGNPHVFIGYINQYISQPACHRDSLGYIQPGYRKALFDITTSDHGETWCPKYVADFQAFRGTISGTQLNFNNYPQIARSEDGNRVYFSWIDDTATTASDQMRPDVWDRALRITDDAMTPLRSISLGDGIHGQNIYYPATSHVMYDLGGGKFRMPTVFLKILNNEQLPCDFYMINNRDFNDADFVAPSRDLEVEVLEPTVNLCTASTTPVKIRIKNVGQVAVNEPFEVTYSVNGAAPVVETFTQSLNVGETKEHTFATPANIAESGTYIFDIRANLPFDQHCKNSSIRRAVVNFGGSNSNLIAESTLAGCGTVTVTTGLTGLPTKWKKGADELTQFANQATITVDAAILGGSSATLTVEVTNPNCAGQTLTDNIDITINEPPVTNFFDADTQICKANGPMILKASPNDSYTFAWQKASTPTGQFTAAGTANQVTVNETGYYRVKVTNPQTGCEVTKETFAILWDIKLTNNIGQPNATVTLCRQKGLSGANSTLPEGYGATYEWYLTGKLVNDAGTFEYNNTLVQSGSNSTLVTPADSVPCAMQYKVVARDPLGCKVDSAKVTATVWTVPTKKWRIMYDGQDITDIEQPEVCVEKLILFENLATRTATPITGVRWSVTPTTGWVIDGTAGDVIPALPALQAKMGSDQITLKLNQNISAGQVRVRLNVASGFNAVVGTDSCFTALEKVFRVKKTDCAAVQDMAGDPCKLGKTPGCVKTPPVLCGGSVVTPDTCNTPALRCYCVSNTPFPDSCYVNKTLCNFNKAWPYILNTADTTKFCEHCETQAKANGLKCIKGVDDKLQSFAQLDVYPNPSKGIFNISAKLHEFDNITLTVFDLTGRVIYSERQKNIIQFQTAISLGDHPSGIYLLKVETGRGYWTERLVKY